VVAAVVVLDQQVAMEQDHFALISQVPLKTNLVQLVQLVEQQLLEIVL
jgi:hypothetical protein